MSVTDRLLGFHQALDEGDFVASIAARQFYVEERLNHPDDLDAWLDAHAVEFIASILTSLERKRRAEVRDRVTKRSFAQAAKLAKEGDLSKLELFKIRFVVDDDDTRRPLGEMTGSDCRFVARNYYHAGNYNLTMAAFFAALERKAGDRKVQDVMRPGEAERLLRSLVGGNEAADAA